MTKELITRAEFARRCGVNQSMITRACLKKLKKAVAGKRIDAAHPDAVAYLKRQELAHAPPVAEGIDPLYEKAIELCRATGRWTHTALRRPLGVGSERAVRIWKAMEAAGVIPAPEDQTPVAVAAAPPIEIIPPQRRVAPKQTKKQAALEDLNNDGVVHIIPDDLSAFADMTLRELIQRFGTDVAMLDWLKAIAQIEIINEKRLKNSRVEGLLVSRKLVKSGVVDVIDAAFVRLLTDGAKTISASAHAITGAGGSVADVRKMVDDQISSFIKPVKFKMQRTLRDA